MGSCRPEKAKIKIHLHRAHTLPSLQHARPISSRMVRYIFRLCSLSLPRRSHRAIVYAIRKDITNMKTVKTVSACERATGEYK